MFVILYMVFVNFLKITDKIPNYPIYLLLGIVLWTFFADLTTQSLGSVVGRGDLIRKIKIPRWMIVFSSSLNALINLSLNLIVIVFLIVVTKMVPQETTPLILLFLLEIYLFALGISLILAAAFVKYRDIGYIWEVVLQAGFYLAPIIYPFSMIKNELAQKLMLLNPVTQAVQDARFALVSHHPNVITAYRIFDGGWYIFVPYLVVLFTLLIGIWYFRRQSPFFAEEL